MGWSQQELREEYDEVLQETLEWLVSRHPDACITDEVKVFEGDRVVTQLDIFGFIEGNPIGVEVKRRVDGYWSEAFENPHDYVWASARKFHNIFGDEVFYVVGRKRNGSDLAIRIVETNRTEPSKRKLPIRLVKGEKTIHEIPAGTSTVPRYRNTHYMHAAGF